MRFAKREAFLAKLIRTAPSVLIIVCAIFAFGCMIGALYTYSVIFVILAAYFGWAHYMVL